MPAKNRKKKYDTRPQAFFIEKILRASKKEKFFTEDFSMILGASFR